MAITRGFGITIDTKTGCAKTWAFRAANDDDGKTYWLADQLCPVPGPNGSNRGVNGPCKYSKHAPMA